MANIVTKNIKGKEYLYLVDSVRKGERVIQKTIKYIGPKRPIPKHEFECMEISYKDKDWVLKDFKDELSYKEHQQMKMASKNYNDYLSRLDSTSKEKEKQKFLSLFISNSNAIEGSTLTPKETFNFLFNDIVPRGHSKKEMFMASNLLEAWNYLEKNCKKFPTNKDIKKLHLIVNKNIESEETLEEYKKVQNYIGDVYTSSYLFVKEKMDQLLQWIKKAYKNIDNFEVAFQSHAQFEIIHPFVDGNGRVGRLLLNWLLMMKKHEPLAIRENRKRDYISSLENSRRGKIEAICRFCFKEYMKQYEFL